MAELDMTAGGAAPFRPEVVSAMHSAVARRLVDPSAVDGITAAFLLLSDDARRADMPAEQLLQTLKSIWEGVPAIQRLSPEERRQHLAELATLCIGVYYQRD